MAKEIVSGPRTDHSVVPPIGPYSNGVVATGSRIVFIAGQVAWDGRGGIVGPGDLGTQYRQVMKSIKAIVEDAGGSMLDICKIVNYVTRGIQREDPPYAEITQVRSEFIPHDFPVSTLVEVTSLMHPNALVEVDAIAVLD